ncbi:hypothetical protein ACEPAI_8125 [Sanghuangporus weigelae]
MTRYTNLGRKRSCFEAGFSDDKIERTLDDVTDDKVLLADVDEKPESHPSQPPAKKRKRSKQKKSKEIEKSSDKQEEKDGDELAKDTEEREENQQVKQAYSKGNREKNRKQEAVMAARSEQRRLQRKQEKLVNTTCFACREKGHAAKDCPKVKSGETSGNRAGKYNLITGICYRCGSSKHTLSRCKKPENPDNPLPYASCYVCTGKGHLASSCPKNKEKGVYPNGGCCKLCGETSHLAKNCPTRRQANNSNVLLVGTGINASPDEDDFHSFKRVNAEIDLEEQKEAKMKTRKRKNQEPKVDSDASHKAHIGTVKTNMMPSSNSASKKKAVVF